MKTLAVILKALFLVSLHRTKDFSCAYETKISEEVEKAIMWRSKMEKISEEKRWDWNSLGKEREIKVELSIMTGAQFGGSF